MTGSITVRQGNKLPTIAISAQSSLNVARGATISVGVSASDPDGTISMVELFAGGTSLGSSTAPPFNLSVSTGPLAPGEYALTARATDNLGGTATSSELSLTIQPPTTLRFTSVRKSGLDLILAWTGGVGPFVIQFKQSMSDPTWTDVGGAATVGNEKTIQGATVRALYFRVRDTAQP